MFLRCCGLSAVWLISGVVLSSSIGSARAGFYTTNSAAGGVHAEVNNVAQSLSFIAPTSFGTFNNPVGVSAGSPSAPDNISIASQYSGFPSTSQDFISLNHHHSTSMGTLVGSGNGIVSAYGRSWAEYFFTSAVASKFELFIVSASVSAVFNGTTAAVGEASVSALLVRTPGTPPIGLSIGIAANNTVGTPSELPTGGTSSTHSIGGNGWRYVGTLPAGASSELSLNTEGTYSEIGESFNSAVSAGLEYRFDVTPIRRFGPGRVDRVIIAPATDLSTTAGPNITVATGVSLPLTGKLIVDGDLVIDRWLSENIDPSGTTVSVDAVRSKIQQSYMGGLGRVLAALPQSHRPKILV